MAVDFDTSGLRHLLRKFSLDTRVDLQHVVNMCPVSSGPWYLGQHFIRKNCSVAVSDLQAATSQLRTNHEFERKPFLLFRKEQMKPFLQGARRGSG
jgi:hypothetical protein